MNKTVLSASIAAALGTATMGAQAALTTSAVLEFDAGVVACVSGVGTPPDNCTYGTRVGNAKMKPGNGSWFGMDTDGNSDIIPGERTPIVMHDGVHIGGTQPASGSHTGVSFGAPGYTGTNFVQVGTTDNTSTGTPLYLKASDPGNPANGTTDTANAFHATTTEAPSVDEPWEFFGNTGMHYLSGGAVITDSGSTKTLDFSTWGVTWNGIPAIPMSGGSWGGGFGDGVAQIVCSTSSCSDSSTFILDYYATVPVGDPSGFGGVKYQLHMEGHVSSAVVPVPAAVWLFGSGLLGLAGVARRKKTS